MKIKEVFLFCIISLFSVGALHSQDASFSNFSQNLNYSNPAFTGSGKTARLMSAYHNRFFSTSGTSIYSNLAADTQFLNNHGIGLNYINDSANRGVLVEQALNFSYAYNLTLGQTMHIRFGTSIGLLNRTLDSGKLSFSNIIDPRSGFAYSQSSLSEIKPAYALDLNVGVVLHHQSFFLGYAIHHFNQPNVSLVGGDSPLSPRHDIQAGINFPLEKGMVTVSNNTVSQNSFLTSRQRVQVVYNHILVGVGTTFDDWSRVPVSLGLDFNRFRLIYNYEERFQPNEQAIKVQAHEINLQIFVNLKNENPDPIIY